MAPQKASTSCISDDALRIPALDKLRGRRVILASSSPRRKEILASVGIHPEIIPSTFEEDLSKSSFAGEKAIQYPAETAAHKALEVYQRLLKENPDAERPPDIVLAADTVVVKDGEIMEKPADKADHVRMLGDLNGGEVSPAEIQCRCAAELWTVLTTTRVALSSRAQSAKSLLESPSSYPRSPPPATSSTPCQRRPTSNLQTRRRRSWKPTLPAAKAWIAQVALPFRERAGS